jgi:hypothetical protein
MADEVAKKVVVILRSVVKMKSLMLQRGRTWLAKPLK